MSDEDEHAHVANVDDVAPIERLMGERWGGVFRPLTPSMRPRGGSLGVNHMTLPPGRALVPFHSHRREDEVFFVLSGRGVLRYGEDVRAIGPGDCVSCPAGTETAHQIANPFEEDLVYLAIGPYDPDEVCVYPDSGKVMVRSVGTVGKLEKTEYMHGEPDVPPVFDQLPDDL